MNFKVWRFGVVIALLVGLLQAGAAIDPDHTTIFGFVKSSCSAALGTFMAYILKHPMPKTDSASV